MSTKCVLITLYATVLLTGVALCALLLFTPLLLHQMNTVSKEWEQDLDGVKSLSNTMWIELQALNGLPRDRLRRQYEEFGNSPASSNYDTSSYSSSNYNYPSQPVAPTYGYGYAKVKCCCAMKNIDYNGEHRNLPLSYKCPVGSQGAPGPTGNPGEDGQPGHPGYNGEDYPTIEPTTIPAYKSSNYGDNVYGQTDNPYSGGGYQSQQPIVDRCEPCPRGPPGVPGTKGKPGLPGNKGDKGIQGIHGIPGLPGNQGPPGDVGVRGKSGIKGLPGPRGADATAGGKGNPGVKGQMGSIGVPGPRGVSGPTGSPGADGIRGRPGIRGIKGQRGLDGTDGVQGPPGIVGADAGYCKCPDRVHNVDTLGAYELNYGRQSSSVSPLKSRVSPPSAVPQQDPHLYGQQQSNSGTSRPMEHRYGVVNEAIYNPLKTSETREYTTSVHVGDLPVNGQIQSTRRELRPPQHSTPYQPPRANFYANDQQQQSQIQTGESYNSNMFNNDEEPLMVQDWSDDVRRRQRVLLAERQRHQRQRYYGRS